MIFLNTDEKSYTGLRLNKGADYLIQGSELFKYDGEKVSATSKMFVVNDGLSWTWVSLGKIEIKTNGRQGELKILKSKLALQNKLLFLYFVADNGSNDKLDVMPDAGAAGFAYSYLK